MIRKASLPDPPLRYRGKTLEAMRPLPLVVCARSLRMREPVTGWGPQSAREGCSQMAAIEAILAEIENAWEPLRVGGLLVMAANRGKKDRNPHKLRC